MSALHTRGEVEFSSGVLSNNELVVSTSVPPFVEHERKFEEISHDVRSKIKLGRPWPVLVPSTASPHLPHICTSRRWASARRVLYHKETLAIRLPRSNQSGRHRNKRPSSELRGVYFRNLGEFCYPDPAGHIFRGISGKSYSRLASLPCARVRNSDGSRG